MRTLGSPSQGELRLRASFPVYPNGSPAQRVPFGKEEGDNGYGAFANSGSGMQLASSDEVALPARFERATFRLGVAPIRHREVTSNAKKCLEIQGFSAFQILSDTTL